MILNQQQLHLAGQMETLKRQLVMPQDLEWYGDFVGDPGRKFEVNCIPPAKLETSSPSAKALPS